MAEREATKMEWIAAINEIRERLAKFSKESADRVASPADKEYVQQQGQLIETLLASFAKKFDRYAEPLWIGVREAGPPIGVQEARRGD